jgi:hypothetical protein
MCDLNQDVRLFLSATFMYPFVGLHSLTHSITTTTTITTL